MPAPVLREKIPPAGKKGVDKGLQKEYTGLRCEKKRKEAHSMLIVRFVCVCEAGLKTAVNCHRGQWGFLCACGMG